MKYAAYGLLAAFLASGVYGDIPTTAEGWYTPSGGFAAQSGTGTIYYGYDRTTGQWQTTTVTVDDEGNIEGGMEDFGRDYDLLTAYQALVKACANEAGLLKLSEAIETIGGNLHDLTSKTGIKITNPQTGQSYTIRFDSGTIAETVGGSGGEIPATTDEENPADMRSLNWTDSSSSSKIQLYGWGSQAASGDFWGTFSTPVAIPVRTANGATMAYRSWYGVDGTSLVPNPDTHKLELSGWRSAGSGIMTPLAEAITKAEADKGAFDEYELVVRNSSKGLNYVSLGTLNLGGVAVDGATITTNTTDGAITSGEASLRGYATASDWAIPYKHGEGSGGTLDWKTPDEWCGVSLAWGDDGSGNKKLDVVNANDYAGKHSKHYFGTSNDKTATLGWHELPNVTTNRVEGDEATIASTVDEQDPGLKRLGLRGWNYQYGGDPLFVVNAGGSIGYIPLPALTNLAACACTQKWENATAWIGGGAEISEDGGLTLPEDSLDEYLYNTLGYIYSTTPGNLHFDNDGEQIRASFTAPSNWADGDSVELTDEGAYQVAGWADASACAASMSAMLSQPTGSDATTHLLLAKKTDSGELHYVKIGDGIQSGAAVDDTTITTNTTHGAVTMGEASIYGWSSAANDTYLSKNEGGNLEWRKVSGGTPDEVSITTNATHGAVTDGAMSILGFSSAQDGTTPVKQNNSIVWNKAASAIEAGSGITITSNSTSQVVSHNLVAGAGISITPAASGTAVTIASATPTSGTVVDPHAQELTFLTELWYDNETHQIKAKRITAKVMFVGTVPAAEEFVAVQCTPHSAEHEAESGSN